jgi:hypothetical protein
VFEVLAEDSVYQFHLGVVLGSEVRIGMFAVQRSNPRQLVPVLQAIGPGIFLGMWNNNPDDSPRLQNSKAFGKEDRNFFTAINMFEEMFRENAFY